MKWRPRGCFAYKRPTSPCGRNFSSFTCWQGRGGEKVRRWWPFNEATWSHRRSGNEHFCFSTGRQGLGVFDLVRTFWIYRPFFLSRYVAGRGNVVNRPADVGHVTSDWLDLNVWGIWIFGQRFGSIWGFIRWKKRDCGADLHICKWGAVLAHCRSACYPSWR